MRTGQSLAQFEILEALGNGEFGEAYRAVDSTSGREVALEILPADGHTVDVERLRQEVSAASALDHWNIAKVYDLGRAGNIDFLIREHVPGRTLDQVVVSGPLEHAHLLDYARQIAGALAAAHGIGVTHRHLHAGNVVVTAQNAPKLVNFGLTPPRPEKAYLAPEQSDGRGADARADIYSFGRLLERLGGPSAPKQLVTIIARAIRKDPARRFQLMEDIRTELDELAHPAVPGADRNRHLLLVIAGSVVALTVIGWWLLGGRDSTAGSAVPLTSDSGLTVGGTISADGRTIAYASDRSSIGVLQIWAQPLSGGSAIRLTNGTEDSHQPAITADRSRIVFRSEQDGGGLYTIAMNGGAPQLLVKGGRDPHFSPDGRWISYWSGDPLSPDDAGIWTIASHGGTPVRIRAEFADARYPVWSPDGRNLLFVGRLEEGRRGRGGDWYVTDFDNGSAKGRVIRTGAETLLHMQAFRESSDAYYSGAFVIPDAWTQGQVLFSGRLTPMGPNNSLPHLLRIPLSTSIMQATGAAHEITSGSNWDARPSVSSNGRVVFTRRAMKPQIWSMALDGSGEPQRLTPDQGEVRFAVSANGKRLAYRVLTADPPEFRVLALDGTGPVIRVVQPNATSDWPPVLSPAGDQLAYTARAMFRVALPETAALVTGQPERISRRGGERILSWSSDGKHMLVQRGSHSVNLLSVDTGEDREFLRDDRWPIVEPRFSPDGKWVVFTVASRPHPQIFVASMERPEQHIELTSEEVSAGAPAWSGDGTQVYFLRQCQGFRCIWSQRLDRRKQPQGEATAFRHLHHARYSLLGGIDPQNVSLAIARDRLIFGMFETTGNIWTLPALPRS